MEDSVENAQKVLNELKEDINERIKGLSNMMQKESITPTQFVTIAAVKGELERFIDAYPELKNY